MGKNSYLFKIVTTFVLAGVTGMTSCAPDVACPTGHQDAKKLFAGAENGKGTEKARTTNGLIKKKRTAKRKKKH